MREATKQATLLLLFCLENRLILDTFNCLDLEDSVIAIAKLWNHIQQFIYNLSFRLYAVFWFWWDIEFGNLLKGLVRRRVLSRGHLYLWRSATRLLRDLSVYSLYFFVWGLTWRVTTFYHHGCEHGSVPHFRLHQGLCTCKRRKEVARLSKKHVYRRWQLLSLKATTNDGKSRQRIEK